jgi:hypothetical protein
MNKLVKITDKKYIKELEYNSDVLMNKHKKFDFDLYMSVQMWYHYVDGIDANSTLKQKTKVFSDLIGFTPSLYPMHTHRNTLWCFYFNDEENVVLIYYDVTGQKIQLGPDFDLNLIDDMLIEVKNRLYKNNQNNNIKKFKDYFL